MTRDPAADRLSAIVETIFNSRSTLLEDRDFVRYFGSMSEADNPLRYIQHKKDMFRLARLDLHDAVVLEAGCGFGITCIALHLLLDARAVHGIDVMADRIAGFRECLKLAAHLIPEGAIIPTLGNVMRTQYEGGTFDFVLSNEAISHYRFIDQFLQEMNRIMKIGGTLIVADSNNGSNRRVVAECRELWRLYESGPAGKHGTHFVQQTYQDMRATMIRSCFPSLTGSDISLLVKCTYGMAEPEITAFCRAHVREGSVDSSLESQVPHRYTTCPINPQTGSVLEQFHRPFGLAGRFEQFGFKAKAYSYFGGAGGNPLIRALNSVLAPCSRFSIPFAPGYRIVARKVRDVAR